LFSLLVVVLEQPAEVLEGDRLGLAGLAGWPCCTCWKRRMVSILRRTSLMGELAASSAAPAMSLLDIRVLNLAV